MQRTANRPRSPDPTEAQCGSMRVNSRARRERSHKPEKSRFGAALVKFFRSSSSFLPFIRKILLHRQSSVQNMKQLTEKRVQEILKIDDLDLRLKRSNLAPKKSNSNALLLYRDREWVAVIRKPSSVSHSRDRVDHQYLVIWLLLSHHSATVSGPNHASLISKISLYPASFPPS